MGGYNTFEDFGMDWEVGDRSVVRGIQGVKIRLFKDGGDGSYFEIRRDGAGWKWSADDFVEGWSNGVGISRGIGSRDEVEMVELRRDILLPLHFYYAAIHLSCYYAAVMLLFKVYYVIIMLLLILKVYYAAIMLLLL